MTAIEWQQVELAELLTPISREERVQPTQEYRLLGARWYAKGLYIKDEKPGTAIAAERLYRVEEGDFVYNRLFAWKGSFAVAGEDVHGCHVSNEFPCFSVNSERLSGRFLWHYLSCESTWNEALGLSSGGTPISRNRLKENQFLGMRIRLPEKREQDRIVKKIDLLAEKLNQVRGAKEHIEREGAAILRSAFARIRDGAPMMKMCDVAPLIRRKVALEMGGEYPELGIRCFGNGTFHKPALDFLSVGTKKLYHIHPGDLVLSNVFAWEGGIAVAKEEDEGRVGSHRFITCVPEEGLATSEFLCFYFLTPEGLKKIGEASPGGAGRNRTLGLKKLDAIEVPVPNYEIQLWFGRLLNAVRRMNAVGHSTDLEMEAVTPSILDKAFKGEL